MKNPPQITTEHVEYAIQIADCEHTQNVFVPVGNRLSPMDQDVLVAMAADEQVSTIQDLAARLNKSPNDIGRYRKCSLDADAAVIAGRGKLKFQYPAATRTRLRNRGLVLEVP